MTGWQLLKTQAMQTAKEARGLHSTVQLLSSSAHIPASTKKRGGGGNHRIAVSPFQSAGINPSICGYSSFNSRSVDFQFAAS